MDRISGANYATVGGKRQFQDLNLAANQVGTDVVSLWLNGAQESLLAPVEDIGLVPSDADNTQLLQAMKLYAGANIQTIAASPANPLTIQNAGINLVSAAAGNVAITLPAAAAANGKPILLRFVRTDSSANAVSIALHAGDTTLFGALAGPFSLTAGETLTLWSDGSTHWIAEGVHGIQGFGASGTFTVPLVTSVLVEVWGPGGGSGAAAAGAAAGGGGGGGYAAGRYAVTPGQSITVTIGAVGTAGTGTGGGGNGGTTSFGSYCSATGGGGSAYQASGAGSGGAGGVGSGGQVNLTGGTGQAAGLTSGIPMGGGGGSGARGTTGGSPSLSTGSSASGFGGGASGGANGNNGNVGCTGYVLVRW